MTRLPTAKPIPRLPRVPTIQTPWRQTILQTRGIPQSVQESEERLPEPVNKVRALNTHYWKQFTSDKWILETVKGYRIEFFERPMQRFIPKQISFTESESVLVQNEVDVLLVKEAIKKVQNPSDEFISNIFLVPKKDGTSRPIINLKNLNEFVEYQHFKQENLQFALELIEKDDY